MVRSRRRRRAKLSLRSSSLDRLEQALLSARDSKAAAEASISVLESELARIAVSKPDDVDRRQLDEEIESFRRAPGNQAGFWRSVLGSSPLKPDAQVRLAQLLDKKAEMVRRQSEYVSAKKRLDFGRARVISCQEACERLERAIDVRRRKREKHEQLRAAAATNSAESRRLALSIKRQIAKASDCPYCGGALGAEPHCDHIYPVSKGGRSTARNMVWVCAMCNQKKRDKTLAAFMKEHGLDRDEIESRLAALGKEF